MVVLLSAMLVMLQSGSVPARADLAFQPRANVLELGELAAPRALQSPVRLARTLSDCDPALIGLDPDAVRLPNSFDLSNCLAMVDRGEPVGRAILWVADTGVQVKTDTGRVELTVRIPTL
jgi:hypothetical protein